MRRISTSVSSLCWLSLCTPIRDARCRLQKRHAKCLTEAGDTQCIHRDGLPMSVRHSTWLLPWVIPCIPPFGVTSPASSYRWNKVMEMWSLTRRQGQYIDGRLFNNVNEETRPRIEHVGRNTLKMVTPGRRKRGRPNFAEAEMDGWTA